jgi:pyrroline-5-carboxylate reductase
LAFLGTGKMGGAILRGVHRPGVDVAGIRATTRTEHAAESLRAEGVEAQSLEVNPEANAWAVAEADVVILGVKPPYIVDLASSVSSHLADDAVVVSVAAGITTDQIEQVVSQPVVRSMPNTPSQIGLGVTGVAAGSRANSDQLQVVSDVFSQVGSVVVVDEDQINALSAISGSGPAYVFYLAEKLMDLAVARGFSVDQAKVMVEGTLLGAATLLHQSTDSAEELRRAVTSPGGTTEQAIGAFDNRNIGGILEEALTRAVARAEEMAKGS